MAESTSTTAPRRTGVSSRMLRCDGPTTPWRSPQGPVIEMPVRFDLMQSDSDGECVWRFEATIDLSDAGEPVVVRMVQESHVGLDLERLQRDFRWASPLEAVCRLAVHMLLEGRDPYAEEFPTSGFPEVTRKAVDRRTLTDEFLEDVARQYLSLGHGYASTLAKRYQVAPRTVVGWIEKARLRGILSGTAPGQKGGRIVPASKRPSPPIQP